MVAFCCAFEEVLLELASAAAELADGEDLEDGERPLHDRQRRVTQVLQTKRQTPHREREDLAGRQ